MPAEYRIIDADGHVMELDEQLAEYIGPPYDGLEWHRSYGFWPGLYRRWQPAVASQGGRLGGRRHRAGRAGLAALSRSSTASSGPSCTRPRA